MKRFVLLLLLVSSVAQAQEVRTLGDMPTQQQVASAQDTIKKAQSSPTSLVIGGYALINIEITTKLTRYVVPGSDDCLKTIFIPKGASYEGWLRSKDSPEYKWTTIAPDPKYDRLLVTGTVNGTATIVWMTVKDGEAVVVAAFQFSVGGGAPKPPDVVPDTPLIKSLRAAYQLDSVAGIGNKDHLGKLEGVYLALSTADLSKIATQKQLTELMANSVKNAGIPDYKTSLTNLRKALQADYLTRQGISDDPASDSKPINQALVKQMFADWAAALGKLGQ